MSRISRKSDSIDGIWYEIDDLDEIDIPIFLLRTATRKRFFNQKEFGSDVGYLSRSFRNSIIDDGIIKDLTFSHSVCNSLEARNKRRCVRTRYQQQKKEKGLNRGTPEHLAISDIVDINGDSLFR
ncbi:hypothetical protein HAX54_041391 [Datura stramonium]|uniref:Uncharacterized protein n=1 Tax=Datura stramonium TaxID=4076 RepID=A0ABS8SLG3_DATST|nr:hypothetical protein [Datura stramonium]